MRWAEVYSSIYAIRAVNGSRVSINKTSIVQMLQQNRRSSNGCTPHKIKQKQKQKQRQRCKELLLYFTSSGRPCELTTKARHFLFVFFASNEMLKRVQSPAAVGAADQRLRLFWHRSRDYAIATVPHTCTVHNLPATPTPLIAQKTHHQKMHAANVATSVAANVAASFDVNVDVNVVVNVDVNVAVTR